MYEQHSLANNSILTFNSHPYRPFPHPPTHTLLALATFVYPNQGPFLASEALLAAFCVFDVYVNMCVVWRCVYLCLTSWYCVGVCVCLSVCGVPESCMEEPCLSQLLQTIRFMRTPSAWLSASLSLFLPVLLCHGIILSVCVCVSRLRDIVFACATVPQMKLLSVQILSSHQKFNTLMGPRS